MTMRASPARRQRARLVVQNRGHDRDGRIAAKARRPLSISYSTAPKLKTSERASSGLPWACSGDM